MFRRWRADKRGQALSEYGLLIAVIAVMIVGSVVVFRDRIAKSYPGYLEQFDVSSPGAKIYFTAQPLFFDLTTEWAASLQKMVAKEITVDEGLDKLADSINRQLKQAGLG